MSAHDMQKILDQVEYLFERYSMERRATVQPYLWKIAHEANPGASFKPDNDLIKETLMEHVGSLPVLSTALYPFINDDEVDLGKALTMLAIHDIGELITGDEMTFTKQPADSIAEYKAALTLLNPLYHEVYMDAEAKVSKSAKFAKAIDKITPDIFDYLTPPDVTIWRYQNYCGVKNPQEIIDLIVKHKRPYMIWNKFMTDFHDFLMVELAKKLDAHIK